MLLLPYAKDVAQRQQSFAAAVAELTGQVKVKFQQQLPNAPPPSSLAPTLPPSAFLCLTSSAKRQTNALAARGLEPISQSHFQVTAALLFPLLPSGLCCGQQAALRRRLARGKFVMQMGSDLIIALDN